MQPHHMYALGSLCIGVTVGALTALSRSPVVAVILPLLFGLIVGGSGFILMREDITQKAGRERLGFAGLCITGLSVGVLLSLAVVMNRDDPRKPYNLMGIKGFANLTTDTQMSLAELRLLTRLMDVSPREQGVILGNAASVARGSGAETADTAPLATAVDSALEEVAALAVLQGEDDTFIDELNTLLHFSRFVAAFDMSADSGDVEQKLYYRSLVEMHEKLRALLDYDSGFLSGYLQDGGEQAEKVLDASTILFRLYMALALYLATVTPDTVSEYTSPLTDARETLIDLANRVRQSGPDDTLNSRGLASIGMRDFPG